MIFFKRKESNILCDTALEKNNNFELTNAMEQGYSWKADSSSEGQEMHCLL
jgi:hypothetical protein